MLAQASNFVNQVDHTLLIILGISIFFLVLITTLMVVFVVKYRKKKNPKAVNIHGSTKLEIIWTVIPTIIVLYMFFLGWNSYKKMITAPKDSMNITVIGSMWNWKFVYPNGVESDTLYVPKNQDIKLNLVSVDVNHSFYVPAFRIKKDVLPNRKNSVWFNSNKIGSYVIMCAEYCGLNHSYMISKVVVQSKDDFDLWLISN